MSHKTLFLKCLCGRNKTLAEKYKKEGFQVKVTSKNAEWRREAARYNVSLPFIVADEKVTKI